MTEEKNNTVQHSISRRQISERVLSTVVEGILVHGVSKRIQKYGFDAYRSENEGIGVLTTEFWEVIQASHSRDVKQLVSELQDIATVAIFFIASMIRETETEAEETTIEQKL